MHWRARPSTRLSTCRRWNRRSPRCRHRAALASRPRRMPAPGSRRRSPTLPRARAARGGAKALRRWPISCSPQPCRSMPPSTRCCTTRPMPCDAASAATMCGVWCNGIRGAAARFASLLCAGVWLLAASGAAAQTMRGVSLVEDRIALVIGNAAYKRDALDNPVNDARLIARTLEKATFQVTLRENLDRAGMFNALREFGARLNENTVAVLYYAGHALQLREQNFMIPIDAEIRSEDEIPVQGIDLSYILAQMSRAKSRV